MIIEWLSQAKPKRRYNFIILAIIAWIVKMLKLKEKAWWLHIKFFAKIKSILKGHKRKLKF